MRCHRLKRWVAPGPDAGVTVKSAIGVEKYRLTVRSRHGVGRCESNSSIRPFRQHRPDKRKVNEPWAACWLFGKWKAWMEVQHNPVLKGWYTYWWPCCLHKSQYVQQVKGCWPMITGTVEVNTSLPIFNDHLLSPPTLDSLPKYPKLTSIVLTTIVAPRYGRPMQRMEIFWSLFWLFGPRHLPKVSYQCCCRFRYFLKYKEAKGPAGCNLGSPTSQITFTTRNCHIGLLESGKSESGSIIKVAVGIVVLDSPGICPSQSPGATMQRRSCSARHAIIGQVDVWENRLMQEKQNARVKVKWFKRRIVLKI